VILEGNNHIFFGNKMNFQDISAKYRAQAGSNSARGTSFERLMVCFLKTYQVYDRKFSNVWQWTDFPYKKDIGDRDTGIDLAALTAEGEFWAVQCKFYKEGTSVPKAAVDSFISTSSRTFTGPDGKKCKFSCRLLIATTDNWSQEAANVCANQDPPFLRISLSDLEAAEVDWAKLDAGIFGAKARTALKTLMEHQKEAVEAFHEHFLEHDRGKLILPCGTGKTFTALKIAEKETKGRGRVLFLAPSIALIGQTLREWTGDAAVKIRPICVCSDREISKKFTYSEDDDTFYGAESLALPATTVPAEIARQLKDAAREHPDQLTVIFSTYQSIGAVSDAIKMVKGEFDLVICDEAHRTTGVIFDKEEESHSDGNDKESHFVMVHKQKSIPARRRLYMTATPRIYHDDAKKKVENTSAVLCSMDDPSLYGEEVYRMGFSEAVKKDLLSDYKVLVLTLKRGHLSPSLQEQVADGKTEINTDEASKFIGCIYALSKRMDVESGILESIDPGPMRKAVAFCQSIKKSRRISQIFNNYKDYYYGSLTAEERRKLVTVSADHVDGTMGASKREEKMNWLKKVPANSRKCNVLSNVRCLSEGVDVPSLDAVIFLSARNSEIEVVQSVGRVMRRSPGKKFGYIIIPIVVNPSLSPEKALNDSQTYRAVWEVLNALKSHDDRFDAKINQIRFNEKKPEDSGGSVLIGQPSLGGENDRSSPELTESDLFSALDNMGEYRDAIYAKLVRKVGSQGDMLSWAEDVAGIAKGHIERITWLVETPGPHQAEFKKFLAQLQKNLNPSVNQEEAVRMLAQHMVTKPVFEALFENYSFTQNNPVSQSLDAMVKLLDAQALEKDAESLKKFYGKSRIKISSLSESMAEEKAKASQFVSGIDNAAARQKIIADLYDGFFRTAFKDVTEKLGIVYTPVELVDFVIHSVAGVLKREFNRDISDKNVHILDPFTGTGTFITRLIQSGLLGKNLAFKYAHELHTNEIVLLAYYIASINIENAYHEAAGQDKGYQPFSGICLTDSFQLHESDESRIKFDTIFRENSERAEAQKKSPIMVIIGNPPYSVGQGDANKNAKNQPYPILDYRVKTAYADRSAANNKNSLYDSYIKAFRWASDRLDSNHGGIIAFVSNSGWLDGSAMDGLRKCLTEEFSKIYVFNLRGNCRTSGELRRKEAGNVFGLGSRTPIAITVLVKNPDHHGPAEIYCHDIGDYLSREDKLRKIAEKHDIYSPEIEWERVIPNESGDWLNKRSDLFSEFIHLGDKDDKNNKKTVFVPFYSNGLKTQRDVWCYNSSLKELKNSIKSTIQFYNSQKQSFFELLGKKKGLTAEKFIDYDSRKISWSRGLINSLSSDKHLAYRSDQICLSLYRPFYKQYLYLDRILNEMTYQIPRLFPSQSHENLVICVSGIGGTKEHTTLISNCIPDLHFNGDSQCFPRYYYEPVDQKQRTIFNQSSDGYVRHDGVTDYILKECQAKYGPKVTKDQIFYYVYGLLHSKDYLETFSSDLKKSLPRIPLLEEPWAFESFFKAGQALAKLHLNYETVKPYSKVEITGLEKGDFTVDKIRFINKDDKSAIQYNPFIKISGIPLETYNYVVNGRSAVEWLLDRYRVTVVKDSGIKNDPNNWAKETDQPRYILDLLLRIITVSLETMKIVAELPKLTFEE
jgi:predicted helicase